VISYERAALTNTANAAFLGLGGGGSRTRNFVSVTMRLVKAQTSEVVESVTVHKSIDSVAAGIYSKNRINPTGQYPELLLLRYPSLSDALDADFSGTMAELNEVALREAIEAAITDLICRGVEYGIWHEWAPKPPGSDPSVNVQGAPSKEPAKVARNTTSASPHAKTAVLASSNLAQAGAADQGADRTTPLQIGLRSSF
jgi:hypothetical protein